MSKDNKWALGFTGEYWAIFITTIAAEQFGTNIRVGRPENIASLTAAFISSEAGFITGANFQVYSFHLRR